MRASTQKETLRASIRTHYVSGLRAPKAFKNGALRHRQLHAGRSDRPEVFLPGHKIELLQDVFLRFYSNPTYAVPILEGN